MTDQPPNPPAFPVEATIIDGESEVHLYQSGMTLREWLVGQIVAGHVCTVEDKQPWAEEIYDCAEALLTEKARREA